MDCDNCFAVQSKNTFALLNTEYLKIFDQRNFNLEFDEFALNDIQTIVLPKQWEKKRCFQIKKNNMGLNIQSNEIEIENTKEPYELMEVLASFCLNKDFEINGWINAIANFKKCSKTNPEEILNYPTKLKNDLKLVEIELDKETEKDEKDEIDEAKKIRKIEEIENELDKETKSLGSEFKELVFYSNIFKKMLLKNGIEGKKK